MVTTSSYGLYKLTKHRAYFRKVIVILPSTWSYKPHYKKVPDDDYFSRATVRIGPPNPKYNDIPYTLQPGGCGEYGRYIHFTPEFLRIIYHTELSDSGIHIDTSVRKCEKLSKMFLNQWLRFRYGVFGEYGVVKSHQFPMFYIGVDNEVRWNMSN